MICWISQNQNLHKYNFSLINLYLNSLLNNYDKFNIFWKSLNCNFWTSYDFFQNFSLFFPNSTSNFLSIELFKFSLRFFFEFIWIIQNKAILIEALSLPFSIRLFCLLPPKAAGRKIYAQNVLVFLFPLCLPSKLTDNIRYSLKNVEFFLNKLIR